MVELNITKQVVLIDNEDLLLVKRYRWAVDKRGYVRGSLPGEKKTVAMGRLLTNAPKTKEVDHINRNKLDNRRSNLRLCSRSENVTNSVKNKSNRFRGVHKHSKSYRAKLKANGKVYLLSGFKTDIEAAIAYNKLAQQHHGEFAVLNEVPMSHFEAWESADEVLETINSFGW